MTPDFGGRPFSLPHYLSVRSAWEVLKPDVMFMHCAHEPSGEWWELAKPMLHVHRVTPVSGIYGFPAAHPAHRADIVRLAALIAMGGIYLDTDVLVVRPFDELMAAEFTAAREVTADGVQVGLSNAILLAQPDARFAKLCLDGHSPDKSLWQGFRSKGRDENYVEFSVRYPCLLADLAPGLLQDLPPESFLWATWDDAGLAKVFTDDVAVPAGVFAIHLWESHAWARHLSKLTPEWIRSEDTTFNKMARRLLPDVSGRAVGSGKAADVDALVRMDEICREADFVSAAHRPPVGLPERMKLRFRKIARAVRDEMTLSVRCRIEELEGRLEEQTRRNGPPAIVKGISVGAGAELPRFGDLDGSAELLAPFLSEGMVRYGIISGGEAEPGVAGWLARRAGFHGAWATTSLTRAKQLSEWTFSSGTALRVVLAPDAGEIVPGKLVGWFRGLEVLVLADPPRHRERWERFSEGSPRIVMTCGDLDAGAADAMAAFAAGSGYRLAAASEDGTFRIFVSPRPVEQPPADRYKRVRTLYGQVIHEPVAP